jgi:transcriptional regulator with XRE-family HTH domain
VFNLPNLACRIKELRNEKDLTQTEFGKIFGVGKTTVSMWENGNNSPDDEIKSKIADYFDTSVDYILGRTDIRKYDTEISAFSTVNTDGLSDEDIDAVKAIIEVFKKKHGK